MLGLIQLLGAIAVLVPFVCSQIGAMRSDSRLYLGLNLAGASVLAVLAADAHSWGFLLLEGTWALVAATGLLARRRPEGAAPHVARCGFALGERSRPPRRG